MQISELAAQAGVPVSAVKYYQREGLLPQGERSAPNQVSYSEVHVQRVRLIRALMGTGGLSVAATKDVIGALDRGPMQDTFRAAQHAMSAGRAADSAPSAAARERIAQLAAASGWVVSADNPGIDAAARALDGLAAIGSVVSAGYLKAYAAAATTVAGADLEAVSELSSPAQIAELMVVGTVLGDPLFAGLRRLAQQDAARHHFPVDGTGTRP